MVNRLAAGDEPIWLIVVDDDDDVLSAMRDYLRQHGFEVETAAGGRDLDHLLAGRRPDLVVLDVMMPGEDGLSICRRLALDGIPILLLSALGDTTDRIVGLETGAADYLAKPFEPRELLARIRAVLRRQASREGGEITAALHFGDWSLEPDEHRLRGPDGVVMPLTGGEARLLRALSERRGRLITRDALLTQVRGLDVDAYDRSIDLLVSRLRRKLAQHGLEGLIETVRGEGYRLTSASKR